MKITTEIFYHYCPAMFNPSKDLADRLTVFFDKGREQCKLVTGDELFSELDNIEFDVKGEKNTPELAVADAMMQLTCITALAIALPSLDLVYTPTGFGVVSNQNLAPASAERVNRLHDELINQGWVAFDDLISKLRLIAVWRDSMHSERFFTSLFWRGEEMVLFGIAQPYRSDLNLRMPDIVRAESVLKSFISTAQFDAFCRAIRENREAGEIGMAISLCRESVAQMALKAPRTHLLKATLLNYLELYPEIFTEYLNSNEYKANHYQGYENKRNDSSYFFS